MQVVNVSNKQIKNFHVDHIGGYQSLQKTKSINCSHNLLGSTDGFSQFQQLYSLDLSHNRISQFFQMASCLVELNLSHNLLGSVFDDFQKSLKAQGTRLYVGSFLMNLRQLRVLDLSYNNISVISSNIFDGNTNLMKINLSNNTLGSPLWCFNRLEQLEIIDLAHNHLNLNDLKPLEKIKLSELNLKFNPLENVEGCDEKLLKCLHYVKKIDLSFAQLEQSVNINSKQSSKLDRSYNSNESSQNLLTDRTIKCKLQQVIPRVARNKTPIHGRQEQGNKTPVKVQQVKIKKNISITPKKIVNLTPQKLNKCEKTIDVKIPIQQLEQDTSTQRVPSLNFQLLNEVKVTPFNLSDINSEREDFPMLFDDDQEKQLSEELRILGETIKQKKQHEVSLERQITISKNIIQLLKVMIKGVYLHDVNQSSGEFDNILSEIEYQFSQPYPKLQPLKVNLMRLNEQHGELNKMFQSLEQSEKIVENIKQLI